MGWREVMVAVEYDGEQHRLDPIQFAYDIARSEDLDELGWTRVRVVKQNRPADIIRRVGRAWDGCGPSKLRADREIARDRDLPAVSA